MLAAFALAGLALAAAGLYALVCDAVGQRRHELAVRLAIGAAPGDIVWLVMREAAVLVVAGMSIGVVLAIALARLLTTLLYGVGRADAVTWTLVPLVLAMVALLAAFAPAHRASRADPLDGLRESL
jgi:ABC-type antimicrobial peptide transport system permease subunit